MDSSPGLSWPCRRESSHSWLSESSLSYSPADRCPHFFDVDPVPKCRHCAWSFECGKDV